MCSALKKQMSIFGLFSGPSSSTLEVTFTNGAGLFGLFVGPDPLLLGGICPDLLCAVHILKKSAVKKWLPIPGPSTFST